MEYWINDEQALKLFVFQTCFRWSGKFQALIWNKHTYPIKSYNLRRHFFSKASGTSQPDLYFFFYFLCHLNLRGFTLSTKWETETLGVIPNPQSLLDTLARKHAGSQKSVCRSFTGVCSSEWHLWKKERGVRLDRRSSEVVLQYCLELRQGVWVFLSLQRWSPGIRSKLPREEIPCMEIILSKEGRIHKVCPWQLGEKMTQFPRVI